jgi:hypothetical protein
MYKRFILVSILMFFLSTPIFGASISDTVTQEKTEGSSSSNMFSTKATTQETDTGTAELLSNMSTAQKMEFFQTQGSDVQSNLNTVSAVDDNTQYFNGLIDIDKIAYLKGLPVQEQVKYFKDLSDEVQMKYFEGLSYETQILFFTQLDSSLKTKIFTSLDKIERSKIFEGLNKYEQSELFESLAKEDASSEIENILSGQFPTDIGKK